MASRDQRVIAKVIELRVLVMVVPRESGRCTRTHDPIASLLRQPSVSSSWRFIAFPHESEQVLSNY
jgi:hypothetical protein